MQLKIISKYNYYIYYSKHFYQYFFQYCFIVLYLSINPLYCSNVDSLKMEIYNSNDKIKNYNVLEKLYDYYKESNQDSSIKYAELKLKAAEQTGNLKYQTISQYDLGYSYYYFNLYDSGDIYFHKCYENVKKYTDEKTYILLDNMAYTDFVMNRYNNSINHRLTQIELLKSQNKQVGLPDIYLDISDCYINMSQHLKALEYVNKALLLSQKTNNKTGLLFSYAKLGEIHKEILNYEKALVYFNKAIELNLLIDDKFALVCNYLNIAQVYAEIKDFKKALEYVDKGKKYLSSITDKIIELSLLIVEEDIYEKMNNNNQAKILLVEAINLADKINNPLLKAVAEISYANILINYDKDTKSAKKYLVHAQKQIEVIDRYDTKALYYRTVASYYFAKNDYKSAYANLTLYQQFQDSVNNTQSKRLMANHEYKRENEIKQSQIDLANIKADKEKTQKYNIFFVLIITSFFVVILIFMFLNKRKINKILAYRNAEIKLANEDLNNLNIVLEDKNIEINNEKEKSDSLLLNILPPSIAHRLKEGENTIADNYEQASVVFVDIVGFTSITANQSPEKTVDMLNEIFTKFDSISEKYGLEKIKTIGDSYMAVSGIPVARADHADRAVEFALEAVNLFKQSDNNIQFRCGVASGPVVAGVIGSKKFIYDLWGDTVNTAYRMEEYGIHNCIQITENVVNSLQNKLLDLVYRGEIDIKGKGLMKTWLLNSK